MSVFDEFKQAWRQAVTNFWEELDADDGTGSGRAAYREVGQVRSQLEELDAAIAATRQRIAEEQEQVEVCERRERMARKIGDEETARIAVEYRERHQERADVLTRKVEALEAERRLCDRDLREMERALQDGRIAGDSPRPELDDLNRHPRENEFRNLEDSDRGRTADERLEELKRRMGQ